MSALAEISFAFLLRVQQELLRLRQAQEQRVLLMRRSWECWELQELQVSWEQRVLPLRELMQQVLLRWVQELLLP